MITGYTGNYTKVYIKLDDAAEADGLLNTFVKVRLTGICRDGMTGEIVL